MQRADGPHGEYIRGPLALGLRGKAERRAGQGSTTLGVSVPTERKLGAAKHSRNIALTGELPET